MTLEQLANLGEFISAIAVIASLIYLAVQIRQNTKSVRSATLLSNTEIWSNLLLKMADTENIRAYMYGMSGNEDIRPKEFAQFLLQCRVLFVSFENQYYQFCNGALDEETYKGYERSICIEIFAYRGFRMYWSLYRENFSPVFVNHVDAMIKRTPETGAFNSLIEWQKLSRKLSTLDQEPAKQVESGTTR